MKVQCAVGCGISKRRSLFSGISQSPVDSAKPEEAVKDLPVSGYEAVAGLGGDREPLEHLAVLHHEARPGLVLVVVRHPHCLMPAVELLNLQIDVRCYLMIFGDSAFNS